MGMRVSKYVSICTCILYAHTLYKCSSRLEIPVKFDACESIPTSSSSDGKLCNPKYQSRSNNDDAQPYNPFQSFSSSTYSSSTYPMSGMYGGNYSPPDFMFRPRMPKEGEDMSDR